MKLMEDVMKSTMPAAAFLVAFSGTALAHPSIQEHAHPHSDAASYFTIETLIIAALGLSIGATIAWVKRKKEADK
jgi:NhaP-type Na+/H+ or K+/H+ antiporter